MNPQYIAWAESAKKAFENAGAAQNAAKLFALLYVSAWAIGAAPRITSIYRTPEHQAELVSKFQGGTGSGFIGEPAKNSKHTLQTFWKNPASLAMDMPSNNIPAVDKIAREIGLGVGTTFTKSDPGHYFLP